MRPSNVRVLERESPKPSTFSASRTSARDHASGARLSSGARRLRLRSECEPSSRRSRWSCADVCTTPSRRP
jgi:hypothetical protein